MLKINKNYDNPDKEQTKSITDPDDGTLSIGDFIQAKDYQFDILDYESMNDYDIRKQYDKFYSKYDGNWKTFSPNYKKQYKKFNRRCY